MSNNEKASVAMYTALTEIINKYNTELAKGANASVTELTKIETEAKAKCGEIATELKKETMNDMLVYENPMVELCRKMQIVVPSFKINKDPKTKVPSSMERSDKLAFLDACAFTEILSKYNAQKDGFVNTGIFASGSCWKYKAEKFAQLMTQRVAKKLEIADKNQQQIKNTYKLTDKAATEGAAVKDPTSNKQMVGLLQEILDAFVFIDNGEGKNMIHATNKDIEFIAGLFDGKDNKDALALKVATGKNIASYIMRVAHALITGSSYRVSGFKQVDGAETITFEPFRDPLPMSAKRVTKVDQQGAAA